MISHFYYQCLDYDKTDVKELTKESSVIKELIMKIFFIKRESEECQYLLYIWKAIK